MSNDEARAIRVTFTPVEEIFSSLETIEDNDRLAEDI